MIITLLITGILLVLVGMLADYYRKEALYYRQAYESQRKDYFNLLDRVSEHE